MERRKAFRYAGWAEVWTKNIKTPPGVTAKEDAERFARGYRPGDLAADPEREEAVFTLVVERGHKLTTRMQTIERGRNGGVRRLVPVANSDDMGSLGGALADLLIPTGGDPLDDQPGKRRVAGHQPAVGGDRT